jgi:hypothetical protein
MASRLLQVSINFNVFSKKIIGVDNTYIIRELQVMIMKFLRALFLPTESTKTIFHSSLFDGSNLHCTTRAD